MLCYVVLVYHPIHPDLTRALSLFLAPLPMSQSVQAKLAELRAKRKVRCLAMTSLGSGCLSCQFF